LISSSMPLDEIKFGDVGFGFEDTNKNGRFDSGETVTSTFMDSHNTGAVTFVITDWNGNVLDDSLTVSMSWTSAYNKSYSASYGGYTTEYIPQDVQVDLTQTANTYTLPAQTYQLAGRHTTQFAVKVDGTTIATIQGDTIYVCSKAPTVTIKDITLDGGNAYSVDLNVTGSLADTSTYTTQSSGCITDYIYTCTTHKDHIFAANNKDYLSRIEDNNRTAWLYFKCNHEDVATYSGGKKNGNTGADFDGHNYVYDGGNGVPAVTLTVSGMGTASGAELVFAKNGGGDVIMITQYTADGSGGTYWGNYSAHGTDRFQWTSDGDCRRFIGVMDNGAGQNGSDTKTVAGTIAADTLILKDANGYEYSFTIPTITIHNPY